MVYCQSEVQDRFMSLGFYSISDFTGGRGIQIFYFSKSTDTTVWKYSFTNRNPAFRVLLKLKYHQQNVLKNQKY